ncbi:efflux RND transporter periplasmic adaptor subunit [Peptostreptococcaceae bacterium OttesenSCG-928-C18]|nr:efflux RND transporter periplasmic adaptor subunit [Peptostreptococcaceae bacterium OttesenSCG-928-C18]
MTKKNKIIIAVVSIFLIVAAVATIFLTGDKKPEVEMYTVEEQNPITFSGSAGASASQDIYLDSTKGEIVKFYVEDDEEVIVGQKLFIYENETIKDTVDELTVEYDNAYSSYKDANSEVSKAKEQLSSANKKVKDLAKEIEDLTNSANPSDPLVAVELQELQKQLEESSVLAQGAEASVSQGEEAAKQLKSQYESIGQKIDSTKKKLNYVETASVAGIIKLSKNAKNNTLSMAETEPVISITSKDIIIQAKVSEYDYEKIKINDKVDIEVANSGEKMEGIITFIDSMPIGSSALSVEQQAGGSNISNYRFDVKPSKPIHYGFSVNIKLPQEDIFLPFEAVERSSGKFYIYKVKDSKAVREEIKVEIEDDIYKLVSGLELGDEIIANVEGIKDGVEVKTNTVEEVIESTDTGSVEESSSVN